MSKCELIELKDLSVSDPIELAAPAARAAPSPVNLGQPSHFHVVRLVGNSVSIESPQPHTATGHDFQPSSHTHLTWCDLCGEFIWGLYRQSLRCNSEYPLNQFFFLNLVIFLIKDQNQDAMKKGADKVRPHISSKKN